MCRMNERAEFLQNIRAVFINMADRLESMTGTEVLDGLSQVKGAQSIYHEERLERTRATQTEPRERPRVPGGRETQWMSVLISAPLRSSSIL